MKLLAAEEFAARVKDRPGCWWKVEPLNDE
jgi:hypothetical protein